MLLQAQAIQIDDTQVEAKIMPIFIALRLKTKLVKELSPIIMALFNSGETNIEQSAKVLHDGINYELIEGIIEVAKSYVVIDGHKLNAELDFANRGITYVYKVMYHFLKTNYADVLEKKSEIMALIGKK